MKEMTYRPTGFAEEIFRKRYAIHHSETWEEAVDRLVSHVGMAEVGEDAARHRDEMRDALLDNMFMPGGRIWYGCGRAKAQLLNCFVIPTEDSREGWGKAIADVIIVSGTGGGVGINCSPIRPRGMHINGTGGVATGAVSFMSIVDAAGEVIKGGGGRRAALLFGLNLSHGDIMEFLDKKLDLGELENANVSVVFDSDPEDFFDLVRSDGEIELKFRGRVIGRQSARELWKKIVDNSIRSGEPGLLNGYYANRMSNIWYHKPLISTNPCGEVWMSEYECCCLGSIVLPRFVSKRGIEWSSLEKCVHTAVRFLDDVLTVNSYPLSEISETCKGLRRIGLGIMGLHDVLLLNDMGYNSAEGLELVHKLMKSVKNFAYEASIELAREKGSFPLLDVDDFLKSHFVKTLKPTIRNKIAEHGIRNCALITLPPTGTTSIVCGVTSGIEPLFAPAYKQWYWDGSERKQKVVVHPLFKQFVAEGRDVSHFQGAYEISLRDHFEMQRTCQMHVDNAVSKTINVVGHVDPEELSELYMEYFPELKGVTIYPDGSRENQPLTPIPLDEAMQYALSAEERPTAMDTCKNGSCDI